MAGIGTSKKSLKPGDPVLNGGPGPDIFDAPAGLSGINGFGGADTVNFNFRLVDATISYDGATVIIESAGSRTEVTGIQTYRFTDGTVSENDGNALVDDLYYYAANPQVWTSGVDAETHFAQFGWRQGRNPSAFFDTNLYLRAYPDVAAAGVNPLEHFHTTGWKEGRVPSVNFDPFQYLLNNPDVAAAGRDPLEHFLSVGRDEGRQAYTSNVSVVGPNGFDYAYYLLHNPDVANSGVDPYQHFLDFGWKEGRNPNAWFDTAGYLATYQDVAAAGVNPFLHYLESGWKEGRNPSPAFDTSDYLDNNPDVAAAGVNPLTHYLAFGVHEGRTPAPDDVFNTQPDSTNLIEGAAVGTDLGILSWGGWLSPFLTWSIVADSSGGAFAINPSTGQTTVVDSSKLDFETSGGSYSLTIRALILGILPLQHTFTIGVSDVPPIFSPVGPGSILEMAANGSTVGITVSASDPNGPPPVYDLTNNAGGRFAIDASTGVITVLNGAAVDFETAPGNAYTITARATVGGSSSSQTLTINVGNVNEAPAGTNHTASVAEDTTYTFTVADFGFSDPADNPAPNSFAGVLITGIAGAGTLTNNGNPVSNGDLVSAADITAGNLKFTPAADASGTNYASFAFQVRDNGGTANGGVNTDPSANTMTIDVTAVNDAPTATNLTQSLTVAEDGAAATLFTLPPVLGDIDSPTVTATLTIAAAAGVLNGAGAATVDGANLVYTITGTPAAVSMALSGVTYDSADDFNGPASVTVAIDDGANGPQGTNPSGTVSINVVAVNDAPDATSLMQSLTIDEDAAATTLFTAAPVVSDIDSPNVTATLTISAAAGVLVGAGAATPSGGDLVYTITGTLAAVNAALAAVTYDSADDFNGAASVAVAIDDGAVGPQGLPNPSGTVSITVNAVNDAPTATNLTQSQTIGEDGAAVPLFAAPVTVSDIDSPDVTVTLTIAAAAGVLNGAGPAAVSGSDLIYTITGPLLAVNLLLATVTYDSAENFNGTASVAVAVDDGAVGPQGLPNPSGTVTIDVTAVNDAPTATGLTQTLNVNEDGAAAPLFAAAVSVADVDSATVTATLTLANPAAGVLSGGGFTPTANPGEYSLTGTPGDVAAALAAVQFDSSDDFNGSTSVAVSITDGLGGPQGLPEPSGTVTINVAAVNDAPTATGLTQILDVNEDGAAAALFAGAVSVADIDSASVTATLTLANPAAGILSGGGFTPTVNPGEYSFTGAPGAVTAALAAVQFDSADDFNGSTTVAVSITDGQGGPQGLPEPSGTVTINVAAVNDAPSLTADDIDPTYAAGVLLFQTTSITTGPVDESTQSIDQLVLTVTNVSNVAGEESLLIDGVAIDLVDGTTPLAGGSVTVVVSGGDATVTVTKTPGISASAMETLVNGIAYTNTNVTAGELARDVTITSIRDTGGTPGVDTFNPNITSTVAFNQSPEIQSNGGGDTAAVSMNENTTVTGVDVNAVDPDNGPSTPLVYSIVAGGDGLLFTIDSNTGVLSFISAPNFENPLDLNADNDYVVTVRAFDGSASDEQTITITVTDVNEPPVITTGNGNTAAINYNENDTAPVADVDATDEDLPAQTLTWSKAGGADAASFNIDSSTGVLTFVAPPNFEAPTDAGGNNTYEVVVRVTDNGTGLLFDEQTITVTVTDINEQPTLTANGATISYTEDTPAENPTSAPLFTGVAVSAVETGQNLDQLVFTVSNVTDADERLLIDGTIVPLALGTYPTAGHGLSVDVAFTGATATVTVSGALSAADMQALIAAIAYSNTDESPTNGARIVTLVSLRDVGSNTGPNDNILENINIAATVNVTAVNDAPVVTVNGAVNTFIEGVGLATGTPVFVDTAFDVNDVDSDNLASATITITAGLQAGDVLSFTPQFGINGSFAAGTLSLIGSASQAEWESVLNSITFATSNQDPTTSRTISIQVNDGTSASTAATKQITITPVNDEPTLTATADGGGAVTFIEAASDNPGSGPIDLFDVADVSTVEAGQTITQVVVTVSNVLDTTEYLVIDGTSVALTAHAQGLTIAGVSSTATVTLDGGTATVTITSAGFTEVQAETLVNSLAYRSDDDTPTATTHTISVTSLTDNGASGGANGDDNTGSPSVSTVVTVQPTNDAPVAADFTFNGSNAAIGNTALVVNDPTDGAPDPTGPQKVISGDLLAGGSDVDTPSGSWTITAVGGGTTVTDANGTIIFEPDGDFTYLPAAGVTGNVIYNYQLNDNDALGNKSDIGQITINIATPKVWYVDATNGSDTTGDGTSDNPFATLTKLNGLTGDGTTNDDVDGAGDIIFLYGGTYTGGIVLEDGQQLISKEHGLVVNGTTLEAANGGSLTTINGTVTLASGATANNIQGIDFGNSTDFALKGTNVGNATVNTITGGAINNTSGGAISIDGSGAGMNLQFSSVSSSGSSTNAISFNEARGTFSTNGGTLSNATGNTVSITGNGVDDDLAFTYGGAINDDGALAVSISGQTGGIKDFNGAITDGAGAGGGISLSNNTGATIRFDGGMTLQTGASAGFSATGGGTVAVTGTNTITTGANTALNVVNTTIDGSGLTFRSISANGGANGIVLNNTGSNGGLTVTGTGSAGSGGTIQNTTSDGVYLNSTINPTLSWMNINDAADNGIFIDAVSGLSLSNLSLVSNGAQAEGGAVHDAGIHIGNLIGNSNTISNSSIVDSRNTNLDWDPNASSSMSTLTVTNTILNHAGGGVASQGNSGLNLVATGSANVKLVINGGQIVNNAAAGIQVTGGSGTTVRTDIDGVDMKSSAPPVDPTGASWGNGVGTNFGINISSTGTSVQRHEITNVQLAYTGIAPGDGGSASAIGFLPSGTGSFDITIRNNTIGLAGVPRSGNENFFGIAGDIQDSVTVRADISNNTIRNTALNGIFIQTRDPSAVAGNSTTDLTVRSNTVGSISDDDDFPFGAGPNQAETHAIRIEARNDSILRLDIAGNSADGLGGNQDYLIRQRDTSTFALERLTGNAADATNIQNFIVGQNPLPGGQTARATVATTFTAIANGTVQDPLLPLSAAQGQGPGGFEPLTSAKAAPILASALAHWVAAGMSAEQLAHLDELEIAIADLPNTVLASVSEHGITIDLDAAGWGWFVDATPLDSSEFDVTLSAAEFAASGGEAGNRIDLLTTIMHELGHALGLDHSDVAGQLMQEGAELGIRRLPTAADVAALAQAMSDAALTLSATPVVGQQIVDGFDATYYLAANPDVAASGVDPKAHFDTFGWHEGRNPNAFFDTAGYLAHYADVAAAGINPLQHYAEFGWQEGRDPSAGFDTEGYLAANPDVAAAHVNPLEHYLQFGVHEGRKAINDGLWN